VSPATAEVTIHHAGRLRLAQFCELQNRQKPAQNNRKRTTIFLKPSRAITPPADC
jgi:hypothetical protein